MHGLIELTLYVPGLLGPEAAYSTEYVPRVEHLSLLLSRGLPRDLAPLSFHGRVNELFGYAVPPDKDIPVAAVSRLVDALERPQGCWMRADPVHLRADRNGLMLIDAALLNISSRDALALAAEVHGCLEGMGAQLEVSAPERWYLKLDHVPDLHTEELDRVIGRDVGVALPEGGAATRWNRLLNELQMLLHASRVNRARDSQGLAPINSLWLWGCGELPAAMERRWTRVHAEDLFARGLGILSETAVAAVPRDAGGLPEDDKSARVLVILDQCRRAVRYRDLETWHAALRDLEGSWFGPCADLIRTGAIRKFDLVTDRQAWRISRPSMYRFWRRRRPLVHFIPGLES